MSVQLAPRIGDLPAAAAILDGRVFVVLDGADSADASVGSGSLLNLVICDGSGPTWKVLASSNWTTISKANAVIALNSTNSNAAKITLQDNGTITGYIGGSDGNDDAVSIHDASGTVIFVFEESTGAVRQTAKSGSLRYDLGTCEIHEGSGSPESVVTAPIGSTFHRTDGGAGTSLYVKESGAGNTGWIGK